MKYIIFIFVAIMSVYHLNSQSCCASSACYVRLDDISGINTDQYQAELQQAACDLVKTFPQEFQEDFKVFDFGFYLHSEKFEGEFPEEFDMAIEQAAKLSNYYLLFGKQLDGSGNCSKVWINVKLPDERKISPCWTEELKNSIELTIQRYVNSFNFQFSIVQYTKYEYDALNYLKNKIDKIVNCCNIQSLPRENLSCGDCINDLDDIESMLINQGFFDFGKFLGNFTENTIQVNIFNKIYDDINSIYSIVFNNNGLKYNFTDAIVNFRQKFLSTNLKYDVNVQYFDDNPVTSEPCYISNLNLNAIPRNNNDVEESIIILNYSGNIKVFTRLIMHNYSFPKNIVYLINDVKLADHNTNYMIQLMDDAIHDSKNIWIKNESFYDIFEYTPITSNNLFENIILDEQNALYHFIKTHPFQSVPIGKTEFIDGLSRIMEKNYEINATGLAYGSIINIGRLDINKKRYEVGFTLAHELAHAYAIRGLRLILWDANLYECFFPGCHGMSSSGHFDYEPNLLSDGRESGIIPKPQINKLDKYEKMNIETKYLINRFIMSTVK